MMFVLRLYSIVLTVDEYFMQVSYSLSSSYIYFIFMLYEGSQYMGSPKAESTPASQRMAERRRILFGRGSHAFYQCYDPRRYVQQLMILKSLFCINITSRPEVQLVPHATKHLLSGDTRVARKEG